MNFPELPKDYYWKSHLLISYGIKCFEVNILRKRRFLPGVTVAEGRGYIDIDKGPDNALNKAFRRAYEDFCTFLRTAELDAKAQAKAKELNR